MCWISGWCVNLKVDPGTELRGREGLSTDLWPLLSSSSVFLWIGLPSPVCPSTSNVIYRSDMCLRISSSVILWCINVNTSNSYKNECLFVVFPIFLDWIFLSLQHAYGLSWACCFIHYCIKIVRKFTCFNATFLIILPVIRLFLSVLDIYWFNKLSSSWIWRWRYDTSCKQRHLNKIF